MESKVRAHSSQSTGLAVADKVSALKASGSGSDGGPATSEAGLSHPQRTAYGIATSTMTFTITGK
jgi:hypothetical protein